MKRAKLYFSAFCMSLIIAAPSVWAGKINQEEVCVDKPCLCMTPASVGGPVSQNKASLTLRWLGAANIELTYNNQVMLLSTYFDVNPREERVIEPETINQVDYIFLGHGHGDHMSDAAQIAEQTGALVFADPIAYNRLRNLDRLGNPIASPYDPVPEEQLRLMENINLERDGAPAEAPPRGVPVVITPDRDGYQLEREIFQFDGFTVEPIHIYHSGIDDPEGPRGPNNASFPLLDAYTANAFDDIPLTQEEIDKKNLIRSKGAGDPNITTQGVRALLFTFGKDFTLIYYDSASTVISESIKDAIARIGGQTDVALVAYAGGHSNTQVPYTMVPIKAFNPRLFIPEHHDGHWEMPVEPLFQAIHDEMPDTQTLSLQYKEPVCFNVNKHIARKTSPQGDVWRYNMKEL